MIGRRVLPDARGYIPGLTQPGDYGRMSRTLAAQIGASDLLWWHVIAPDGSSCRLNPSIHTVTEHDGGTITVHPSIVTSSWHGWLERGIWRTCDE